MTTELDPYIRIAVLEKANEMLESQLSALSIQNWELAVRIREQSLHIITLEMGSIENLMQIL